MICGTATTTTNCKKALLLTLLLLALAIGDCQQIQLRSRKDDGSDSDSSLIKKTVDRRALYPYPWSRAAHRDGLHDLSNSPYDTVFIKRGNYDDHFRDGLDEPDSIGKTILCGAILTFSLPAQMAVFLAGHIQTGQDMHDFNNLSQKMKDKYDQRFKEIDDDAVNTNKWTTWTQGRERMKVFDDITNGFWSFISDIQYSFWDTLHSIEGKMVNAVTQIQDKVKEKIKQDEKDGNSTKPNRPAGTEEKTFNQKVLDQVNNDFQQVMHRIGQISKRIPQMLLETGNFWTDLVFHSNKEHEKEKSTFDDSATVGNQFKQSENTAEIDSEYESAEVEKYERKTKQLVVLYIFTTILIIVFIVLAICFFRKDKNLLGWLSIAIMLLTIFIAAMIYESITVSDS